MTKSLVTIHGEASPKRLPRYDFEIETDALAVSRENLGSLYRTPTKTLKEKYPHLQGKPVYSSNNDIYEIHMIMGIVTLKNIRSDVTIKGEEGEPVIEKTKFGWTVYEGAEGIVNMCLFSNSCENEHRELYLWDVLGLQDDAEHLQETVHD